MGSERAFVLLCVVPRLLLRDTVCDRLPLLHARAGHHRGKATEHRMLKRSHVGSAVRVPRALSWQLWRAFR